MKMKYLVFKWSQIVNLNFLQQKHKPLIEYIDSNNIYLKKILFWKVIGIFWNLYFEGHLEKSVCAL